MDSYGYNTCDINGNAERIPRYRGNERANRKCVVNQVSVASYDFRVLHLYIIE